MQLHKPQITTFILVQGGKPLHGKHCGGHLICARATPMVLDYDKLDPNDFSDWTVYAAGINAIGMKTVFYPIAIVQQLPRSDKAAIYVKYSQSEREFKIEAKNVKSAVRMYLNRMYGLGEFRQYNTVAQIRIKPFIPVAQFVGQGI
jgi:hypothetical protein